MKEVTISEMKKMQSEGKKLLVDFKAAWCRPCQQLIPQLEQLSENYDNVEFIMIDVDKNTNEAVELGIKSIPTVIIFNGETLVDKTSGVKSMSYYKELIETL